MAFPPVPVYPASIDSDYTLYLVYNTTEARLTADNAPWSQEVSIMPVDVDQPEIWADNGFANIDGELFYYDSVELDENGKVNKLKGCARQLGGEKTKLNKKGTWVRSFVVAEHHNQLVDCVMKTQNFIGYNFDPRRETLDWRVRNLQDLEVIFDDYACPDVNFTFNILENSPTAGILIEYIIEVTPPGTISDFRLDFGDGDFTTTALTGQHRYAVNARMDPVVRVSNDKCQIVQTPIERTNPAEPAAEGTASFDVPLPEIPTVPEFTFVPCEVPEPDIQVPPLVIPCGISIEGPIGPSVITGPNINMVSNITITSNNPVQILYSVVTITGGENIPSFIIIDPPIPPTIIIDPPIPPTIVIVPPNSNITIDLDVGELPRFEVDWGVPPEMQVQLTMAKAVRSPERFASDPALSAEFGEEFADLFDVANTMKVEYEPAGIPSEITVLLPDDPVKFDTDELFSRKIQIDSTSVKLPDSIQIFGPDKPLPDSISIDASGFLEAIDQLRAVRPKLDASEVPTSIMLEMEREIPNRIVVDIPKPIPDKIVIEHNLPEKFILEGPTGIPLILPENFYLPVKFPDIMPEIRVAPIELKISMEEVTNKEADGRQCVMIVPCGNS